MIIKINLFCLIALLHLIPFRGFSEEESIIVKLATESTLAPLYFLPFSTEQSDLEKPYVQELEKILMFDLDNNGLTFVSKRTEENNRIPITSTAAWKGQISYVIKGQIQDKKLTLLMLDVQKQSLKTTEPFILTGDLNLDRRQIHRASDVIHKVFSGTEGIATTHLLYTVKRTLEGTKTLSEVWEIDYDGENPRQITQESSLCVTPAYIPPKPGFLAGGFLYVSYALGQPKIYVSSLKNGKKSRLTTLPGNQLMPAISRQRDKVAFISDVTGNPDLFLQNFDPEKGAIGKPQQIFSARQATQGSPTFSPDGSQVAFVSNKDGSPKIYIIDIPQPGTNLKDIKATLISKANRENTAPAWSPDGKKLAYCSRSSGDRQIWVYDFNTNREKQITQGSGHKENPSWAPNSLHIVYNTSDSKGGELFIINLNQTNSIQITKGAGEKGFPSWEPKNLL